MVNTARKLRSRAKGPSWDLISGRIHSLSRALRRIPIQHPIFLYAYQTRNFERALASQRGGVDCYQEQSLGNSPIIQDQGLVISTGCHPWCWRNQQWMFGYNSFYFSIPGYSCSARLASINKSGIYTSFFWLLENPLLPCFFLCYHFFHGE
jgi:hypothetical protein